MVLFEKGVSGNPVGRPGGCVELRAPPHSGSDARLGCVHLDPAGRNWFYDMFTRGVERQDGFRSFTFPSNVSPYFPAKEWEEARRTLPEDVFRQEYMAEFLEDSAGVFRGVDGCLVEAGEESLTEAQRRSARPGKSLTPRRPAITMTV